MGLDAARAVVDGVRQFLPPWYYSQLILLPLALLVYKCRRYYFLARRVVQIYSFVIPPFVDFQLLKLRKRLWGWDKEEFHDEKYKFHERCANRVFVAVCTLGGYFIKNGQRFALMKGLLPKPYYAALQPLFAEVPERSFTVMAKVFHDSTGKSITDVFEHMEPKCLGAASLAQTYKGTLRPEYHDGKSDTRDVVVKIQYPEVDIHFALDVQNILLLTRRFLPDAYDSTKAEADQHIRELDLRNEADNLKRVGVAMERAGLMPKKLVVPQPVEALTTRKTLVMDHLQGTTFEKVSRNCLEQMRKAKGLKDDKSLKVEGIQGAAEAGAAASDGGHGDASSSHADKHNPLFHGPSKLIRTIGRKTHIVEGKVVESFTKVQQLLIGLTKAREIMGDYQRIVHTMELVAQAEGYQILLDGCVNVDPHPGNIICMDDGRVGLIDFGQCAFLSKQDRRKLAKIFVAIRDNDRDATIAGMKDLGFACKNEDGPIIERYAVWAFDRIDITPLLYDNRGGRKVGFNVLGFFVTHPLVSTPEAYAAVRRVAEMLLSATLKFGGKAMCPLCSAWSDMADELLLQEDDDDDETGGGGPLKFFNFFRKVRRKSYRHHLAVSLENKRKKALGLDIVEGAIRHTLSAKQLADWKKRIKLLELKEKKEKEAKDPKKKHGFRFSRHGHDDDDDDKVTTDDGKDIVKLEIVDPEAPPEPVRVNGAKHAAKKADCC